MQLSVCSTKGKLTRTCCKKLTYFGAYLLKRTTFRPISHSSW